ncbi:sugar ABC transporter substrate-binding protein [Paractinoplanes toevensis]|uniref:Sugar ABC transporter substrate-binding protein n=2 Tax=Paractinoplanes toevensis TaxID=571911 RepID=A0A919TJZ5_9ACTN|nr:sugar ABC transporter substrate-binding protein [Actinoplanes toevensis]
MAATLTLVAGSAGCTGGASDEAEQGGGAITGAITVLTNRTDLVDTALPAYAKAFEAKYPGTKVSFEGVTNYEGDVTTQLSGGDYGDVLLIPNTVTVDQLSQFFEPLGSVDALKAKFRFTDEKAYDGQVYGLSVGGVASGVVVNKRVWADAGITAPPKTPEEFLAGLRAIKAKTQATPFYTNYKDGWPLSIFNSQRAILADPAINEKFPADPAPWQPGKIEYVTDGLLYDIVHAGLSEKDPLTTNWEGSKPMLASGKVATMLLGSWAVPQMKAPDDVAFWPFPYQSGGKFHSRIEGDYKAGVARTSKNKATARAFLDWYVTDSGFARDQQAIPTAVDQPLPPALQDFRNTGVELLEIPAATTNAGKEDMIIKDSEIDLTGNIYRQKLIDIARGAAKGDKESYFAELNKRWAASQARVMK